MLAWGKASWLSMPTCICVHKWMDVHARLCECMHACEHPQTRTHVGATCILRMRHACTCAHPHAHMCVHAQKLAYLPLAYMCMHAPARPSSCMHQEFLPCSRLPTRLSGCVHASSWCLGPACPPARPSARQPASLAACTRNWCPPQGSDAHTHAQGDCGRGTGVQPAAARAQRFAHCRRCRSAGVADRRER